MKKENEKLLESLNFKYSFNTDGYHQVWYRDNLRAEIEEDGTLTVYDNNKVIDLNDII